MKASDFDLTAIAQTAHTLIDDHLRSGRPFAFNLATSSMWPSLAPGDRIHIRPVRADACRAGDILVRGVGNAWIVHRLIRRADNGDGMIFVTKGDNALTADAAWPAAQLAGVVVAVERATRKRAAPAAQPRAPSGWQARFIAGLSRGQLLTHRIEPAVCRRLAIKISRVCLRAAARLTR